MTLHVIVVPESTPLIDLYAALAMGALLCRRHPEDDVRIQALDGEKTYRGVEVDPSHYWESVEKGLLVYHIGCGDSLFDPGVTTPERNSLLLFCYQFGARFPDWLFLAGELRRKDPVRRKLFLEAVYGLEVKKRGGADLRELLVYACRSLKHVLWDD